MYLQTQKTSVRPNEPAYWFVGHVGFITLCINQTLFIKCFIVHKWASYVYAARLGPYFYGCKGTIETGEF